MIASTDLAKLFVPKPLPDPNWMTQSPILQAKWSDFTGDPKTDLETFQRFAKEQGLAP